MPFEKGMKKNPLSGKKLGSVHPITYAKARDEIIKSNKSPIAEILALLPQIEPKEQIKAWFELLTWLEAKPKAELENHATSIELKLANYTDEELDAMIRGKLKQFKMD